MQKLTINEGILSNLGLSLDFKLLRASSNSSSWRVYSSNNVFETSISCLKSLEEVGIEDASVGPISVKHLLHPFFLECNF